MSNPSQPPGLTMSFAPWVECQQERCRGGRVLITAVNHRDGHAMYLDPTDIDPRSGDRYHATMAELLEGGFIAASGGATPATVDHIPVKPAGAGLVWRGADRFVRRCHAAGLHKVFSRSWLAAQVALAVLGAVAFALTVRTDGFELHAQPGQILGIVILGLVAVTIHELGHALVTVHYGRRVRMAGVRLHLGTPAFYVESVDALLLTRRQRLIQAGAGPWAEWLVTSVAAIAFVALPHDMVGSAILHRFVIVNTFVVLSNLLPFVGLDGSMLLADATRQPDLAFRTQRALVARADTYPGRWLTAYATANAIVAAALLVAAGFFWWQLFGGLGSQVWALGPAGVLLVLIAGAALAHQALPMIASTFTSVAPQASRLRATISFRLERRWRVRAMTALRVLPGISELDESDLGILAGRLQRVCSPGSIASNLSGHFYVHRAPRRHRQASAATRLVKGAIAELDLTRTGLPGRGVTLIALPEDWQQFLPRQRAVATAGVG